MEGSTCRTLNNFLPKQEGCLWTGRKNEGFPKPWKSYLPQELLPEIAGRYACEVLSAANFTSDITIKVGSLEHHSHHDHCLRHRKTQSLISTTVPVTPRICHWVEGIHSPAISL